jgi:hypothetical protein
VTSCFAHWWCSARAAMRTGETSDDLKSWLLERLSNVLSAGFNFCERLRIRAEELRRNHRPQTQRSPCTVPACGLGHAPRTRRFCASIRSGVTVQPLDFPEISLFPQRASGSRAAFRGNAHQRLMRSAPGTVPSISPGQLLCKLFLVCNLAHRFAGTRHSLREL